MSNITWANKSTGDSFSAADANEVKAAVNSKQDALPYKVYTVLLNQSETNDPVATVLQNTLTVSPTIQRIDIGVYNFTSTEFIESSTVFFISPNIFGGLVQCYFNGTNTIQVYTEFDGTLFNTPFEIRVYE